MNTNGSFLFDLIKNRRPELSEDEVEIEAGLVMERLVEKLDNNKDVVSLVEKIDLKEAERLIGGEVKDIPKGKEKYWEELFMVVKRLIEEAADE